MGWDTAVKKKKRKHVLSEYISGLQFSGLQLSSCKEIFPTNNPKLANSPKALFHWRKISRHGCNVHLVYRSQPDSGARETESSVWEKILSCPEGRTTGLSTWSLKTDSLALTLPPGVGQELMDLDCGGKVLGYMSGNSSGSEDSLAM